MIGNFIYLVLQKIKYIAKKDCQAVVAKFYRVILQVFQRQAIINQDPIGHKISQLPVILLAAMGILCSDYETVF